MFRPIREGHWTASGPRVSWRMSVVAGLAAVLLLAIVACGERDEPEETLEIADLLAHDEILGLGTEPFTGDLPQLRERTLIRALVPYNRTEFFIRDGIPRGLQAELLQSFEKQLNQGVSEPHQRVRVRFVPVPFARLIPALLEGHGDLAAAMLTLTPEREAQVAFASGRALEVDEVVIAHRSVTDLHTLEDLAGRALLVMRGSSHETHLRQLNETFAAAGQPPLDILLADPFMTSADILQLVNAGVVRLTIADDYLADLWARVLPDLRVRKDLALRQGAHVGWAVRPDNPLLREELEGFFATHKKGTLICNVLFQRYFENTRWIRDPTAREERDRLRTLLGTFEHYGERYGFEALALAAQAYQESGLDHSKRSPKGAIGIMQVLPSTAQDRHVGIPDIHRLDANIHAGTKYLRFLHDRYFSSPEIAPADQLALGWAAYNAGPARVRRMQALAEQMGLDPNTWFENVETAAARLVGAETVDYVANIHKYYLAYKLAAHLENQKEDLRRQRGG